MIAIAVLACASAHSRVHAGDTLVRPDATWTDEVNAALAVYERHGLIVLPFDGVGQFFFLAGPTPDSTRVLFSASYPVTPSEEIAFELAHDGTPVHWFRVRAAVFQQTITLAPGTYRLMLGTFDRPVTVPHMGPNSLNPPIPMLHGEALPGATALVERDTAIDVYLEAYGASRTPVTLSAPGWRDTVALERHGDMSSGTIQVPLSRLAPGATTLVFARGRDSVTTPVFVGFGFTTAVSFDQTLSALRYFVPAERLDSLRQVPRDERPQAWATFMARYGQRLPEYFDRVREANKRYTEWGVPGWETDRGSAYVQLGDPDQVFVEPDVEIWLYTRYFGRLKFDHRRLLPESHEMLETLVARARTAR